MKGERDEGDAGRTDEGEGIVRGMSQAEIEEDGCSLLVDDMIGGRAKDMLSFFASHH